MRNVNTFGITQAHLASHRMLGAVSFRTRPSTASTTLREQIFLACAYPWDVYLMSDAIRTAMRRLRCDGFDATIFCQRLVVRSHSYYCKDGSSRSRWMVARVAQILVLRTREAIQHPTRLHICPTNPNATDRRVYEEYNSAEIELR